MVTERSSATLLLLESHRQSAPAFALLVEALRYRE
jgi:hypothetical protein